MTQFIFRHRHTRAILIIAAVSAAAATRVLETIMHDQSAWESLDYI